ncbi:hypothetical protein JTB14_001689 [Gonioctena quinquepunctata]|nr:hypothetical protein JTB14_001689 [Gonioctena quinquepunctata]
MINGKGHFGKLEQVDEPETRYNCGKIGHFAKEYRTREVRGGQMNFSCYQCVKMGTFPGTVTVAENRKRGRNAIYVIRKDNSNGLPERRNGRGNGKRYRGFGHQANGRLENSRQDFASTNRKSGDNRRYTRYFGGTTPGNGSTGTIRKQSGQNERSPLR